MDRMSDTLSDQAWMRRSQFVAVSADSPRAKLSPRLTEDLWNYLDAKRSQLIRRGDADGAIAVNRTIIRLEDIAAKLDITIGRSRITPRWSEEQRSAARDRAKANEFWRRSRSRS
jgi:hypothetical protein